jgi:hypothetical protein
MAITVHHRRPRRKNSQAGHLDIAVLFERGSESFPTIRKK